MDNRDELIKQLSVSMGVGKFAETNPTEKSYFDTETGTLYCDGIAISKSTAEKAIHHFEVLAKRCDMKDAAQREMAIIYKCAIESIKMMQDPDIKSLLKSKKNM